MKAPCPHLQVCTGCPLMRLPYLSQLKRKAEGAEKTLGKRYLKPGSALKLMLSAPERLGTRISAKLALQEDASGPRRMGLFRQGTKTVVAIPSCVVHHPGVGAVLAQVPLKGRRGPAFYDHTGKDFQPGRLKFITVRHSPETGASGVVVSHTGVEPAVLAQWLTPFKADISIYGVTLGRDDGDRILNQSYTHLQGPKTVPFKVGDEIFELSPMVFFQNNYALAPELIRRTVDFAGPKGALLDLYGGMGAYTFHARGFTRSELVDLDGASIEVAKAHAATKGMNNFKAHAQPVEAVLSRMSAAAAAELSHVIVNPPRRGLSPVVVRGLLSKKFSALKTIHYVSCNLESLRHDLDLFVAGGFHVSRLTPFDLFPQTAHLESLVVLTR